MSETRVRGKDFTGYRIGGAIAAVLLSVALLIQVWEMFDGDAMTVPEVRWEAANPAAHAETSQVLTQRTLLQGERFATGPSPEAEAPPLAIGDEIFLTNSQIPEPREYDQLVRNWADAGEDAQNILALADRRIGLSSLPYPNADLFERPFARDWRLGVADFATHLGALAILGFSLLLALILAIRGRVPIVHGKSGRKVKRFGLLERATHWMTSVSFIMLALTGIVIAYGDTLILPFGEATLGQTGWLSTWGHMMFAPPFALGLVIMLVMWIGRNLPEKRDLTWLKKAGGFFSDADDAPPARKFNAGQKLIFWSAILGGGFMVASGVTLMFPFFWLGLAGMSWAMLIHAIFGLLLIAIFIGHIYIGTVGMQGAFWAMWDGKVDYNWAEEHHKIWLAEIENAERRAK
ncbi:formate dehydrogenase subunit gamma [Roseivivax sp. CAU 1761]